MFRLAAVAALLALTGCSDAVTRQEPVPASDAEHATPGNRAGDAGQAFDGDVYFGRVPGSTSLFIAFDGGERGQAPDRVIDQVFVLQSESEPGGVLPAQIPRARLLYTRGSVVVQAAGAGRPIRFTVAGKAPASVGRARPMDWSGHGLSRRTGQWPLVDGVPLQEVLKSALASCSRGDGLVQLMGFCDSGGRGSTGCGTSCPGGGYCSVSCGPGYFSCCQAGACSCTCVNSVAPDPGSA